MRSIWRGAVSFGLVSIGVKLYTATEDHDIRFNQVHAVDGGRIKYRRGGSVQGEGGGQTRVGDGRGVPRGQSGGATRRGVRGPAGARGRGDQGAAVARPA